MKDEEQMMDAFLEDPDSIFWLQSQFCVKQNPLNELKDTPLKVFETDATIRAL